MPIKVRNVNIPKIKRKKKVKEKISIFLLIILVIIFGVLVGTSLSRYKSIITGKIIAQIAKPVLEERREESILVTANNPKASYSFEVRNYKEEQLNEVEMEYYIEIVSRGRRGNSIWTLSRRNTSRINK